MPGESEKQNEVLQALDLAMSVERAGYRFYTNAAETTSSSSGKRMFAGLARDEIRHFGWLASQRVAVEETGHFAAFDEEPAPDNVPVFPETTGPASGVKVDAHELDALERGIKAEQDSIALYEGMITRTGDYNGLAMLKRLVQMEEGHLQLLQAEHDYLTKSGMYFGVPEYNLESMD